MTREYIFKNKANAKGRNGYFVPVRAHICDMQHVQTENTPRYWLEIWSKRQGDHPPLRLELSQSDLLGLMGECYALILNPTEGSGT
jgi:hypothetical protein